jgi:hypothetical protein
VRVVGHVAIVADNGERSTYRLACPLKHAFSSCKLEAVDTVVANLLIIGFGLAGLIQGRSGAGFVLGLTLFLLVIVNAYFLARDRWPILRRLVGWSYTAIIMFGALIFLADLAVFLVTGKPFIPFEGHPHTEIDDGGSDHHEIRMPEVRPPMLRE